MTETFRRWILWIAAAPAFAAGCSSAPGFRPLLTDSDLKGWTEVGSSGAWSYRDGVLRCDGKKDGYAWLSTDRKYGDFVLSLEWRIGPGANTGVFCRVPSREGRASMTGFEVQIADDAGAKNPTERTGSIFNRVANPTPVAQLLGEWHRYEITCRGSRLRLVCDGHQLIELDMAEVPVDPANLPALRDVPAEGFIGLQNHGTPAEFRNIRIRELGRP